MVQLPQVKQEKTETEIGSHFVANYPPFSVWSPEHVPAAVEKLDAGPYPQTPLGLYVHIPFCRKRCRFCYFRVYTDKNGSEVDVYMDALAREVDLYADRKGHEGRQFAFV